MDAISNAAHIAVVGSPSTNYEVTLDLLGSATRTPLVGSMLCLTQPLDTGDELAIGTVTEVTTNNTWHQNPLLRGVVKTRGSIPGMSGDTGDVRAASIKLQACYRQSADGAWVQAGPTLRMSPPTGTPVRQVTNEVIDELMAGEEDLHYLGHLHNTNVRIPMSIRDFSGERGSFHTICCGISGSGKSAFSAYYFAGQMRHRDHGMIIIDPQGQWASEVGLPFSLQEWAREMGREVVVRRVSEDLRLEKDAPLLANLLSKTRFCAEIMKMSPETGEFLLEEFAKIMRKNKTWDEADSRTLLRDTLNDLNDPRVLNRIYAVEASRERLADALVEILEDADRFTDLFAQFQPLHNLFAPTNPGGGKRHSMWGTISHVFDIEGRNHAPAPLLILDMSTSGAVSWESSILADDDQAAMLDALRILDQDSVKASILRKACRTLKDASETAFRGGRTLNTMVVFDEAWRYVPPAHMTNDDEIKGLSLDMEGYFRDTRKFGIGWSLVTQSPRSVSSACFDQTTVRVLGYGLGGADLAKIAEGMDDPSHLTLYKGFSPPDSTKPKVYPFMLTGPVSPLSFSKAPVFLSAYTDFDEFRADNHEWISHIRLSQGLPVLSGAPKRPSGPGAAPIRAASTSGGGGRRPTAAQIERVRAHRSTGGVDLAVTTGLSTDATFARGLSSIDDEDPPF